MLSPLTEVLAFASHTKKENFNPLCSLFEHNKTKNDKITILLVTEHYLKFRIKGPLHHFYFIFFYFCEWPLNRKWVWIECNYTELLSFNRLPACNSILIRYSVICNRIHYDFPSLWRQEHEEDLLLESRKCNRNMGKDGMHGLLQNCKSFSKMFILIEHSWY